MIFGRQIEMEVIGANGLYFVQFEGEWKSQFESDLIDSDGWCCTKDEFIWNLIPSATSVTLIHTTLEDAIDAMDRIAMIIN